MLLCYKKYIKFKKTFIFLLHTLQKQCNIISVR
nr:MAG TPA: hypothetical protein [Bacteriophage sp.]